jgi:hypothetical protein
MYRTMGELKDMSTHFRKYLNQDKVYVSPVVLGLVNTHTIGVTLHDDDTPMSVFAKRVLEINLSNYLTNGIAIQVAIKDGKQTKQYTDKLAKAIEYANKRRNHPVISQCVLSRSDGVPPLNKTPFAASFECRTSSFTTLNMLDSMD